eukprot:75865-Amorphochlora_amoeboformis.AAC.1
MSPLQDDYLFKWGQALRLPFHGHSDTCQSALIPPDFVTLIQIYAQCTRHLESRSKGILHALI